MDFQMDSELLKALGHPVRLRIVKGLLKDQCCVTQIAEKLGTPQSTVSQHLALLKNKGILYPVKTGLKTCYNVINDKVKRIIEILE
jgi:ArsR family transcriptional regulator